jgi:leucyl aminopeptidase
LALKRNFAQTNWKDLLPEAFGWLDNLKIESIQGVESGAHHMVVVENDDKSSAGFKVLSKGLSSDLEDKIKTAAQRLGWKGAGSITLEAENAIFSLVATTMVKTSDCQKSRQLGLDYSKLIKGKDLSDVVICGSESNNALDIFDGLALGFYDVHVFKDSSKKALFPKAFKLMGQFQESEISERLAMAKSLTFTRFLQDAPPNVMDSEFLASVSSDMAKSLKLKCSIKGREEIKNMGMGAFTSVADGTPIDPQLITIEIPGKDTSKTVALIGKGLTFDAGGISIKPSAGMHEMKYDMSGGAAVLGTAMFLGMVQPPVNVVCVVGAVENMPGVTATRPGDIVKAMNGKTIEVLNTDAEGRLVLVDLLHYAIRDFKPDMMIDIATLTGAVLHGLGTAGSALMSNDQDTADYLLAVSRKAGEPFWQLPLWPENEKEIKSDIADYKNIAAGNVKGGSIVAGEFLKAFVGDSKWAHLDIAGTGWSCKATGYPSAGGSAFGVRIMSHACLNYGQ